MLDIIVACGGLLATIFVPQVAFNLTIQFANSHSSSCITCISDIRVSRTVSAPGHRQLVSLMSVERDG